MSLSQALSTYLTLNLLVAVGYIGLRIVWFATKGRGTSAVAELKLHYALLTVIGILTLAHPFVPRNEIFEPAAKVMSAQSMRSFSSDYTVPDQGGYLMVPTLSSSYSIHTDRLSMALALLALLVIGAGLLCVARDLNTLVGIRRRSIAIRKIGAVTLYTNDDITVPFSAWLPRRADVVIPSLFLSKHPDFKMAVAHELQHHRQGDTRWVYVMWAFKVLCPANPFVTRWNSWISEVQEFACDETLVDRKKVEPLHYARCLVEVAEAANSRRYGPACATGLVFLVERNLLKRRIERMIHVNTHPRGRSISLACGLVIIAMMAGVAYASNGLVQDRRVSMEDAQRFAIKAQQNSDFPVIVNDLVLKQLNRYIGTHEGREFMKNALQRMGKYRTVIEGKIRDHGVPGELMAVPITVASPAQTPTPSPPKCHGSDWERWNRPTGPAPG